MKEIKVSGGNYGKPSSLNKSFGFDESLRQDINSKVIGVLNYNNNIRKKLLSKNIGLYELSNVNTVINNISDIYSNLSSKPFPYYKEGLLGYTHTVRNDYQTSINKKYNIGEYIEYYVNKDNQNDVSFRWNGEYSDYTEYMSNLLNIKISSFSVIRELFKNNKVKNSSTYENTEEDNLNILSVINDFLQYDNIKYAMEKTRIGTINPNPLAALLGATTTNISNYSGKDTSLGNITNYLYAQTLRNGAQFNSLRRTNYITPNAYEYIGNKLHTLSTLASDFRIDDETGRLIYDFGFKNGGKTKNWDNVDFSDSPLGNISFDYSKEPFTSEEAKWRNIYQNQNPEIIGVNRKGYLPFNNTQYDYENEILINPFNSYIPVLKYNGNYVYNTWCEYDNYSSLSEIESEEKNRDGYKTIVSDEVEGLLKVTSDLYNSNKIGTLVSRFYSSYDKDNKHNETNLFQTAVSSFGISHGRNLLSKGDDKNKMSLNYRNPYCRVWTWHHQYDNINKTLRSPEFNKNFQSNWELHGRREGSTGRLDLHSVLNKNGFVNITPIRTPGEIGGFLVETKKCMFSIENLAWKDINESNLSNEQIGPNGGRIMWFPPYDLKFNEQISVNWSPNDFIGRGEKVYTYTNTERTGTLSFKLLVDHPSLVDMWTNYGDNKTNDKDEDEQTVLRFFAGCDKLDLKDSYTYEEDVEVKKDKVEWETEYIKGDNIVFFIFFPNNYSGYNDNLDDVIYYLVKEGYENNNIIKSPIYENYKWCYRVDKDFINHKLNNENNYYNNWSYRLNSILYNRDSGYKNDNLNAATHSFLEIFEKGDEILKDNVNIKAEISTYTTSHGYKNSNNILNNRRSDFAKKFLKEKLNLEDKKITIISEEVVPMKETDNFVSSFNAKISRCCKIVISREIKKTIDSYYNEYNSYLKNNMNGIIKNAINDISFTGKNEEIMSKYTINDWFQEMYGTEFKINEDKSISKKVIIPESDTEIITKTKTKNYKSKNFDDESQYFKLLEQNDNITYKRIIDKIKYFSPAFHSITPEGFNARLGFLHQCTRQGPTSSSSDDVTLKSAGNLSFGRPPVCVLRIGDFFNTKIIIDSISIDYETQQWDMNPEGIGVQPIFASISLNFKFLGGSDLEAPISRLQNALSFNYYANQSIYDNRADISSYDIATNKVKYETPWTPK